jgi:hypothetical protein
MKPNLHLIAAASALFTFSVCSAYADEPLNGASDPLLSEVAKLPAAYHRIPLEKVRPQNAPLPSGDLNVEGELKWRALYEPQTKAGRAAGRVVQPMAQVNQLEDFIRQVEKVDDTDETRVPNVAELQDPRAVPALRRALARLKTPMKRLFVLQALYACGDWNHPTSLIELIQGRVHDTSAFDLLILYHPREATQVALELLDMAESVHYGLNKRRSHAMVGIAINALEKLAHPNVEQIYVNYFQKWPAPLVAIKFGDRNMHETKQLVREALAKSESSPHFNNFTSTMAYRYALARMGDINSTRWMIEKASLLMTAPDAGERARLKWDKIHTFTAGAIGPFCDLLVKLNTTEAFAAYVDLLSKEAGKRVQSSIRSTSLYLINNEAIVDSLSLYFDRQYKLEMSSGLTDPKKVLALYPNNPKAKRLFVKFVPDGDVRDDLLLLANEFGVAGLNPHLGPFKP